MPKWHFKLCAPYAILAQQNQQNLLSKTYPQTRAPQRN